MDIYQKMQEKYSFLNPYNHLYDLPTGWIKCFGELFCEDISNAVRENNIENYQVLQAEERFGELRWYDIGCEETQNIINDYSFLSRHTCTICGKVFVPIMDDGWVCPYCKKCYKENRHFNKEEPNWENIIIKESEEEINKTEYEIVMFSPSKDIVRRDISYILNRISKEFKE